MREKTFAEKVLTDKNLTYAAKGFWAAHNCANGSFESFTKEEDSHLIDELVAFGLMDIESDGIYEFVTPEHFNTKS